jgi:hypothetical protein
MGEREQQQLPKEKVDKMNKMSLGEVAAAVEAMGNPVALRIRGRLLDPEPPSQVKKNKRIKDIDKVIVEFFLKNI